MTTNAEDRRPQASCHEKSMSRECGAELSRLRILLGETTESWRTLAAEHFLAAAMAAVATRGAFHVVVPGGSTPRLAFAAVVEAGSLLDWRRVHVYFGDERVVAPDHPDSNYRMMREAFLDHVPIPAEQVYRIEGERVAEDAAALYEETLARFLGGSKETKFDLVILGLGPDGHVASLIPGCPLDSSGAWVGVGRAPMSNAAVRRVTMTPAALRRACELALWVRGEDKANVVRHALRGGGATMVPEVEPVDGRTTWILDRAAASQLTGE